MPACWAGSFAILFRDLITLRRDATPAGSSLAQKLGSLRPRTRSLRKALSRASPPLNNCDEARPPRTPLALRQSMHGTRAPATSRTFRSQKFTTPPCCASCDHAPPPTPHQKRGSPHVTKAKTSTPSNSTHISAITNFPAPIRLRLANSTRLGRGRTSTRWWWRWYQYQC
jgi:hypothetical protein